MDSELIQLLSLEMPKEEIREVGFLEITGMAHHENVNSRIYAYFLDAFNDKSISDLFINSLLEIVQEKSTKQFDFGDFIVHTELTVQSGKRIDIALHDVNGKKAIIVENKIYHILNNALDEYWSHFKYNDEDKIGVVLSLYPISGYNHQDKFINITHFDWISKIKSKGLPSGLSSKMYIYLNDFFKTIEYLTKTNHMNDQSKFFFEHARKVNLARQTYEEANRFLIDQMEVLASKLGWKTYGTSLGWRNIWDQERHFDTYYTIWYQPLLNGQLKVSIIIELMNEDLKREEELKPLLEGNELYSKMVRGVSGKNYLQFATREYTLDLKQIELLSETLYGFIQSDFKPVMEIILGHYYPEIIQNQE